MRFSSTLLILLALIAYAWIRRKATRPWGGPLSCLFVALVLGLGVHLGDRVVTGRRWYPLGALACAAVPVVLAYWLVLYQFFCRAVPRRPGLRSIYHGAVVLLIVAVGHLYPFHQLWPRSGGSSAERTHLSALGRSAPITSPRYNLLARKLGLEKVKITVVLSALPMAHVLSFRGAVARVTVTNRLLELLSEEEMAFVIAHELWHHRDDHYAVRLAAAGGALTLFFLGLWCMVRLSHPAVAAGPAGGGELGVFLRLLPVPIALAAVLALPLCALCRSQELDADRAAVHALGGGRPAICALEKLEGSVPAFVRTELRAFSIHPSTDRRNEAIRRLDSR